MEPPRGNPAMTILLRLARAVAVWTWFLGTVGFLAGFVTIWGVKCPRWLGDLQLPLALPEQIGIDNEGRLYCGLAFYRKIQVYDSSGRFLRGWFVHSDKFGVRIEDYKVHVRTFANAHYVYDLHGNLLETSLYGDPAGSPDFQKHRVALKGGGLGPVSDHAGNRYSIQPHWLLPKIIKVDASGKTSVLVSSPIYIAIFVGPLAAWITAAASMLIVGGIDRIAGNGDTRDAAHGG
jgi:hypothetical protein